MFADLLIRFELCTEMVVPDHPIPFEALLMKARAVKDLAPLDRDPFGLPHVELPLARHPDYPQLYLAGLGLIEAAGRHVQFITKRPEKDMPDTVDLSGGFFKPVYRTVYTLAPPIAVTFHARGNKAAVGELLPFVYAVGARRSQGYGRVCKYTVGETAEAGYWEHEGRPGRAIPIEYRPDKTAEWYYAPFPLALPGYTTQDVRLCYLPRPYEWLRIGEQGGTHFP
ncbi:MAG TPA: hypothetical protein VMS09_08625 [Paenibacillus sp.]|nr:hypothetical protein [Paenibacillus sp.]HUC92077.1 hypothetical protein [Paenibacillus sp.]